MSSKKDSLGSSQLKEDAATWDLLLVKPPCMLCALGRCREKTKRLRSAVAMQCARQHSIGSKGLPPLTHEA